VALQRVRIKCDPYQMIWYELIGLAGLKELEAFIRTRR